MVECEVQFDDGPIEAINKTFNFLPRLGEQLRLYVGESHQIEAFVVKAVVHISLETHATSASPTTQPA
jgi:hypothetical protein